VPGGGEDAAPVATVGGVDLDLVADPTADQGLPQRRLDRDVQVVEWGLDWVDHQEPLLRALARSGPLTLLTATKDIDHSQAAVLIEQLHSAQ
jgi:hypothetical protein